MAMRRKVEEVEAAAPRRGKDRDEKTRAKKAKNETEEKNEKEEKKGKNENEKQTCPAKEIDTNQEQEAKQGEDCIESVYAVIDTHALSGAAAAPAAVLAPAAPATPAASVALVAPAEYHLSHRAGEESSEAVNLHRKVTDTGASGDTSVSTKASVPIVNTDEVSAPKRQRKTLRNLFGRRDSG